jgi:hypothetical protein
MAKIAALPAAEHVDVLGAYEHGLERIITRAIVGMFLAQGEDQEVERA